MQLPELSDIAGGSEKMYITLENSLELSYKVKYLSTDWPLHSTSRYLPKENGNVSTKKLKQEIF